MVALSPAASIYIQHQLIQGYHVGQNAPEQIPERLKQLANSLAEADFKSILLSEEARSVLSNPKVFADLASNGTYESNNGPELATDSLSTLIVAIACLHAFVQLNWTGPELDFSVLDLLPSSDDLASSTSTAPTAESIDAAALHFLTLGGEPAYHLSRSCSLLLVALRLLNSLSSQSLETSPWWNLRLQLIHQSLLDEPVALPDDLLPSLEALLPTLQDADLIARLHLELGFAHNLHSHDKLANQSFALAAQSSGLEYKLTGAMGKRTKWQIDDLSQLVLLARSRQRDEQRDEEEAKVRSLDKERLMDDTMSETSTLVQPPLPSTLALNDDTLLEETEFTHSVNTGASSSGPLESMDPANQPALHPLDQSLLLALCLSQHNNSPSSGLTSSQMLPFLARVIAHPINWSVHTTALLLRARLESGRSRTVERSTLQLAALIDQMPTSDSELRERLRYFHQLPLPNKWEMERELAKRYLSIGVTRSALDIFTRLEMWEDAVKCLQHMERDDEAVAIVKDLLEGRKTETDLVPLLGKATLTDIKRAKISAARQAKLYCLLGDLALATPEGKEQSKAHYEHAWELSGHTSSRAMRSLGSIYVAENDYEAAIEPLRKALAINPLYARTWFVLGCCFVRAERWEDAKEAFRRDVQIDEEDGEGWNNLAAVYLRMGETKGETPGPVSFDNKLLAFRALRNGLRYARDNWRMWQNFMIISIDVGELSEAARAMTAVVEAKNIVDADVLDKLVDSVTRDDWADRHGRVAVTSNEGLGLMPIVERLFDVVILPRVSDSPRVFRAHARLLRWKEEWPAAIDAYIKAYRCGVASRQAVETDRELWLEAVQEVEDVVDVLQLLGPRAAAGNWRFQARGLVRTFMGRTKASFEDEPEFERLRELLEELKN